MLALMRQNIALNSLEDKVTALQLDWYVLPFYPPSPSRSRVLQSRSRGAPLPQEIKQSPPQLILAADCVYFEPAFPLLVQTLKDLTEINDISPDILFCYKKRRKADRRFFLLLKKDFEWVEVEDHPDKESYRREAISLMRVVRRRPGISKISAANAVIPTLESDVAPDLQTSLQQ